MSQTPHLEAMDTLFGDVGELNYLQALQRVQPFTETPESFAALTILLKGCFQELGGIRQSDISPELWNTMMWMKNNMVSSDLTLATPQTVLAVDLVQTMENSIMED